MNLRLRFQDEEDFKKASVAPGSRSKLAKPIQELIKMIFDIESMKKAMVEFEVKQLCDIIRLAYRYTVVLPQRNSSSAAIQVISASDDRSV